MEGVGLAIAMQMNRILLPHPDSVNLKWETNIEFCKNQKKYSLECYYENYSNCTLQHALRDNPKKLEFILGDDILDLFESKAKTNEIVTKYSNITTIEIQYQKISSIRSLIRHFLPNFILPIISCSPIRLDSYFYYWRAISVTYFIRPNNNTLALLSKYRNISLIDLELNQCISVHIRHGDKKKEMKLIPFTKYMETAQLMWDLNLVQHFDQEDDMILTTLRNVQTHTNIQNNTVTQSNMNMNINSNENLIIGSNKNSNINPVASLLARNGTIFLSTEDPDVINEANQWSIENKWKIYYTNLIDKTSFIHNNELEYLSMLLNLEYSLKCSAYVCTLASNSCRIIDELRATIGGKANKHYADLSIETCYNPPCIGSKDITFID